MDLAKKLEYAKIHADFMLQDQTAPAEDLQAAVLELKALIDAKLAENLGYKSA